MERTLEDFFNECEPKRSKPPKKEKKVKTSKAKQSFKEFFKEAFSLDALENLSDETSALYRKNYVISNIISVSNVLFIIFSFIGFKSNYIVTIAFFLLVTGLSLAIKKMLEVKEDDYHHQVLVMYLQSIFIFIKTVVLYIKTYLGYQGELTLAEFSVTQAAYFLIFYSIVIESLYQDMKLLRYSYIWIFLIMTVINITLLHPDLYSHGHSLSELFSYMFVSNKEIGIDIILRTFVLLIFFGALYISTTVTTNSNTKRRAEFNKRVDVENNFKDVVTSVFDAVKAYNLDADPIKTSLESRKIVAVSVELAKALNLDNKSIEIIKDNAAIHIEYLNELTINDEDTENYERIGLKAELATSLMKRLQLNKKAEDITYHVFESDLNDTFISKVKPDGLDIENNVILLSEIYIILRSDRSYKKALTHQRALEMIVEDFKMFFMEDLILRFRKFNSEIARAYEFN